MIQGFAGQVGFLRHLDLCAVAHAVDGEADVVLGLLITADPRCERPGEGCGLQRVDGIDRTVGVDGEIELADGAASDLREEGVQLELHGFGGEDLFEQSVLAGEHAEEREVGVITDREYVSAGTLRVGELLPR